MSEIDMPDDVIRTEEIASNVLDSNPALIVDFSGLTKDERRRLLQYGHDCAYEGFEAGLDAGFKAGVASAVNKTTPEQAARLKALAARDEGRAYLRGMFDTLRIIEEAEGGL